MAPRRPSLASPDAARPIARRARTVAQRRLPPAGHAAWRRRDRLATCWWIRASPSSSLIPPGDLLVLNTTRVRHARLLGTRPPARPRRCSCIHPGADGTWIAMGKPGSALQPGQADRAWRPASTVETVAVLRRREPRGAFHRRHGRGGDGAVRPAAAAALHHAGPDPTRRRAVPDGLRRARRAASPRRRRACTSRPDLLDALEPRRACRLARLDLEVGPGTFKPVEVERSRASTPCTRSGSRSPRPPRRRSR